MRIERPYDWVETLDLAPDTYVFEIALKYNWETEWTVVTSYYEMYDFAPNTWEWDWWEGQQDVKFLRYCSIRDVFHPDKWITLDKSL